MNYFFSAAAAILPMLIYLFLIWRFDRYDREPIGLVLQNYLWGALGAIILTLIFGTMIGRFAAFFIIDDKDLSFLDTIIVAPVIEEITKGIFLLITAANRKFDNMTDGIVYGGAIGLGFGMTENFLYFITYGNTFSDWIFLVIIRTFFSAVMHCIATATLGAFLGNAKFRRGASKIILPALGLCTAILLHFSWNFSVSYQATALAGIILMISIAGVFVIVFSVSVFGEKKIIYSELLDEANLGIIPFEHLAILNSTRRNRNGWIDENKRKPYIKAAITLAFRKMQSRNSSGADKYFYEKDIEEYRQNIQEMLLNKNE